MTKSSTLVVCTCPSRDVADLRQLLDYYDGVKGGRIEGENIISAAVRTLRELLDEREKHAKLRTVAN